MAKYSVNQPAAARPLAELQRYRRYTVGCGILGVTYPNGFTDDSSVVSQYRVLSMPTTIFINSRGEVFRRWNGALNQEVLIEVTNDMLRQESNPLP